MRQTWAMLVDAYRELNARKLFWVTLTLSVAVVGLMASVGITDKGPNFLGFNLPLPILSTNLIKAADFYKAVFFGFGYTVWLSYAAIGLAIISTASIIPEFVSSGAIELNLSKPISRVRLFLTKYVTGVLFVGLQVLVFTALSFLLIGIRGGEWQFGLFWAVPLLVILFSYLYCVSALIGLLTRSPITSLLAVGVLWLVVIALDHVESSWLLSSTTVNRLAVDVHRAEIQEREKQLDAMRKVIERDEQTLQTQMPKADQPASESSDPWPGMDKLNNTQEQRREQAERLQREIAEFKEKLQQVQDELEEQQRYHAIVMGVKTFLPKTTETKDFLSRRLFAGDEFDLVIQRAEQQQQDRGGRNRTMRGVGAVRVAERAIHRELEETLHKRSATWVIGTSLGFEAIVLGIACIIFIRRDF